MWRGRGACCCLCWNQGKVACSAQVCATPDRPVVRMVSCHDKKTARKQRGGRPFTWRSTGRQSCHGRQQIYAYFHRNTCICIRPILGQTSSVCPSFSCRRRQGSHPPSPSFLHSGRCSYTSLCSSYASLCSAASLPQPGDRNTAAKRGREDFRWFSVARLGENP